MSQQVWAVLDASGNPFCEYDSIDEFEDSSEATVPLEPQENGQLFAYDKVPQPNELSLRLLFSGDYAKQNGALSALDQYRQSTQMLTIVTPSRVFSNMTLVGTSTTRSSTNGVNMLEVQCSFREIRSAQVSTQTVEWAPKNPTSADNVNRGQVHGGLVADALFGS